MPEFPVTVEMIADTAPWREAWELIADEIERQLNVRIDRDS